MTLTELKYTSSPWPRKHFGRAAEACHVSQPTLSVAIKKLEEELELKIFERNANEVTVTPLGDEVLRQAQTVLEQVTPSARLPSVAESLARPLEAGCDHTIGPYLLPDLVRR